MSNLSRYDLIDIAHLIGSAGINLGVLAWMFVRLERVWIQNGSLDLLWNFIGRTASWQFLAYLIYCFFYAVF